MALKCNKYNKSTIFCVISNEINREAQLFEVSSKRSLTLTDAFSLIAKYNRFTIPHKSELTRSFKLIENAVQQFHFSESSFRI